MTSLLRFSALTATTLAAVLSMTAGLAIAGDNVSADQIVNALQPRPLTRGLSLPAPADPAARAREEGFIDSLRNRATRSLSLGERAEIADLTPTEPRIDLEIQFDYNSARIARTSSEAVQELGKALSNPALRGSTFVVAGHTDGIGGYAFNQDLSERRADTIKRYLVENYGIAGSDVVTVGYGKTRLKDAQDPTDPINRRVEIVNLQTQSVSNKVAPCCASQ
jgi:outer membrane protein OmpA-like peptidoglycan-associated protein